MLPPRRNFRVGNSEQHCRTSESAIVNAVQGNNIKSNCRVPNLDKSCEKYGHAGVNGTPSERLRPFCAAVVNVEVVRARGASD